MNPDIASLVVSIISAGVAIAAFIVARRDPRPRITGWMNAVLHVPLETSTAGVITAIMLHVTLTNSREYPAHLVDYKLEVGTGQGTLPLERLKNISEFPALTYGDRRITLDRDVLVYWPPQPIGYGQALSGLLVFYAQIPDLVEQPNDEYNLTVVDVFGRRYPIRYGGPGVSGFDQAELFEMAGAKVEPVSPT